MLNFIISSESTCDLTADQITANNFSVIPMNFLVGEKEYSSTDGLSTDEICKRMREGQSGKTFQVTVEQATDYLSELLKQGKDIVHLSFSSAMSGTCDNFRRAAQALNAAEKSANKIYIVDTLCQSFGVAFLMYWAKEQAEKNGWDARQTVDFIESKKLTVSHTFVVDDLKFLARGGRLNAPMAFIGNIIKLKPVLHLNSNGQIVQRVKVIGRKKSITTVIEEFKKHYNGDCKQVFISESACRQEAESVAVRLKEINPEIEIIINQLGPVITSHAGPGVMAVYFTVNDRME